MSVVCRLTHPDGRTSDLEVDEGVSLMQAALAQGVAGIQGDCGGACQCATCHVYVDASWIDKLPPVDDTEDAMLECTASPRQPNSRLACQLVPSSALNGLPVTLPSTQ
ncbi:MAG: (2Fe-2S)-binding protein [Aquincola sp.]|mgnify:CR=1 FL=1|nr:(2Fe-2S)-binding protein [Aquincola sp.]|tara:strand:+ start:335 stop:658 length:324 start_codon:yes stop_codon:yes gene_type:complete